MLNILLKKRRAILFLTAIILFFFPLQTFAWEILSFDDDIRIQQNGKVLVVETIRADYRSDPHHGLLRYIPVEYKDAQGKDFSIDLKILGVFDEQGNEWEYSKTFKDNNIVLKIGDGNKFIQSVATFRIIYETDGVINHFPDHDELYWNVTGNGWDVPINDSTASIMFDQKIADDVLKSVCYTGKAGSTEKNCKAEVKQGGIKISMIKPQINQTKPALETGEGLTIAVSFPTNYIIPRTPLEKATNWISKFIVNQSGLLFAILLVMFFAAKWYAHGRDPKIDRTTIMPLYSPPDNLTPAEVGVIIDQSVDQHDITATIVHLAIRGYLKIEQISKTTIKPFSAADFKFIKKKNYENDPVLLKHEITVLNAIFRGKDERKLSEMKSTFYRDFPNIVKEVYQHVIEEGFFIANPEKLRDRYMAIGCGMTLIPVFGMAVFFLSGHGTFAIELIIAGIICTYIARQIGARTKKGAETYYKILGLKEYINTAEKDRIKFHEQQNVFEKLLPYAMALGIADKWSKTFEGIYQSPPDWYSSYQGFSGPFTTVFLVQNLNVASTKIASSMVVSSSSSSSASRGSSGMSSGSSGGGFGGGGGSSW